MAETRSFTIGPTWALIAEGAGDRDGPTIRVNASGPFVLCLTVGRRADIPELPALIGHRYAGEIDIPLAGEQRLWASASPAVTMQVT